MPPEDPKHEYIPHRQRHKLRLAPEVVAKLDAWYAEEEEKRKLLRAEKARKKAEALEVKLHPPRPPKIFGYVRCSHQDSKDSGRGEDAQHTLVARDADFQRGKRPELPQEIDWMHEPEAVSAFKVPMRMRKMGRKMCRELRNGDHVIFAYLDRAFRDTEDCLSTLNEWKRKGVVAHFADVRIDMDTAVGELLITILAAVARMDSALKSERIKVVLRGLSKEWGRRNGGQPRMGFKLTGRAGDRRHATMDWDCRALMAEVVRVRDTYKWPWVEIARYLNDYLTQQQAQGKISKNPKSRWQRPNWNKDRARRAYREEFLIREEEAQRKAAREARERERAQRQAQQGEAASQAG